MLKVLTLSILFSIKPLSIRTLLELNESCLRLHGFNDPWYEDKKLENIASISRFNSRLEELDKYTNQDDKWLELFRGLLAGKIISLEIIIKLNSNHFREYI